MPPPSTSTAGTSARGVSQQTRRRNTGRRNVRAESFIDRKFSLRDVGNTANVALQVGKQALALVNAEKKFLYAADSDLMSTTATVTPITLMAAGDTSSTRDGLSVRWKGLDLRWAIQAGAALDDMDQDFVRVILVRQTVSNGVALPVGQVLTVATDFNSPFNWTYRMGYKILYDEVVALDFYNRSRVGTVHIPLDNVSTWNSTGNAIADTQTGVYYIIALSQENTAQATLLWSTQMYFYDN